MSRPSRRVRFEPVDPAWVIWKGEEGSAQPAASDEFRRLGFWDVKWDTPNMGAPEMVHEIHLVFLPSPP